MNFFLHRSAKCRFNLRCHRLKTSLLQNKTSTLSRKLIVLSKNLLNHHITRLKSQQATDSELIPTNTTLSETF